MGILHELLAAEPSLRKAAEGTLAGIRQLFLQGQERLTGMVRTYKPFEEGGQEYPSERVKRATSVDEELAKLAEGYGAWIDASVQKEMTNADAGAELQIGSRTVYLSATALLNLESKLEDIIGLYSSVPLLDPAVAWEWDEGETQWRSPVEMRLKTEKRQEGIVLYAATPEHAAQTQLITRDVKAGQYETVVFSGRLARNDAQGRLDRAKALLVAVKRARARANEQEVEPVEVAQDIFAYINGSKPQR